MTETARTRAVVGGSVTALAVAGFFWWGTHFAVFGSDINWVDHPEQVGLPLLLVLAAFGVGFMFDGFRAGAKTSLWMAGLYVAAAVVGAVRTAI